MISKSSKIIVLMPPKTASNSIRESLEIQGIQFSKPSRKISTPLIHLKLNEISEIFDVDNLLEYRICQITRDPYFRFVSSYYHLMRMVNDIPSIKFYKYDFLKFTHHFHESIKTENFIKNFYGNTSFIDHCVNNGISWGGSRVFDTQKSWGNPESNISYFKLEDISKEISPINNFLSTKIPSLLNINKSNLIHQYNSLLTPKIKDIILEVFEEDFKIFNYET